MTCSAQICIGDRHNLGLGNATPVSRGEMRSRIGRPAKGGKKQTAFDQDAYNAQYYAAKKPIAKRKRGFSHASVDAKMCIAKE